MYKVFILRIQSTFSLSDGPRRKHRQIKMYDLSHPSTQCFSSIRVSQPQRCGYFWTQVVGMYESQAVLY